MKYKIFPLIILFISTLSRHGYTQTSWVDSTINTMNLDEKIGQLFMIAAYSNQDAIYEKQLENTIKKYHIGGIIFFQGTPHKQARMTNRYQQISRIPLLIGMDAESGIGWRVKQAMEFPNQTLLGAIQNSKILYQIGEAIGEDCQLLGVHVNFAPVVDINVNPKNPVIGIRAFGDDKTIVSEKSIAYMRGLSSQNIMAVAKHFPGHGDTELDSHLALPIMRHSMERLDTLELYPFKQMIAAGVPAMMISHLNIPVYDSTQIPATLSKQVINKLLRKQLEFQGLCFTDAMNMKGVTQGRKKGEAEVLALAAGNDILLFPENVHEAIKRIKEAIRTKILTPEMIDEKCRRILQAKEKYVLPHLATIDTLHLIQHMNTSKDSTLLEKTYAEAITLIKNKNLLLPLQKLDTLKIASLNFGEHKANYFEEMLSSYTPCKHFSISPKSSSTQITELLKKLSNYNCIIIYNSAARNSAAKQFGASIQLVNIIKKLKDKKIILCHPATPYGLDLYSHLPLDAMLISYSHDKPAQKFVAQAIFGGIKIDGKLPVSINFSYPARFGLTTPKIRLGYQRPEACGFNSTTLQKVDSLCIDAIQNKATPGCQVLIAKDGFIVYDKAFGYNTYNKKQANHTNNIYDIASVTKIAATLPAIMLLYDRHKIDLDTPIAHYDTSLSNTNKADITIRELLLHMAALKPAFSFFSHAIDYDNLPGKLFTTKRTPQNTKKLRDRLYVNPHFHYKDSTFSFKEQKDFQRICPNFYIHNHFKDSIHELLILTERLPKKNYRYSDLGFVLLKDIIEKVTQKTFDSFCKEELYTAIGAFDTDFIAHERLDMKRVIPSAHDNIFRKSHLKGYVHDPIAALLGGISGNAGLFSSAHDLAKIMSMYLNHGSYGGKHFIDSSTIALFTRPQVDLEKNRRGLGFDKPETNPKRISPTATNAPISSYGHTGFTGTMAWNDPDNHIIYIFLSNRTYPNEFNDKLIKENYRTKIQEVIYKALHLPNQTPENCGNNS